MSGVTVLRAEHHVPMPWANGGGTTYEVMTSPVGARLDDFDWRVSLAEIATDGPFSPFPGVDRLIAVVEGAGVQLVVDGRVVPLGPLDPFAFDGAAHTSCRLIGGPTKDLNVMTRRGRCSATLDVVALDATADVAPVDGGTVLVVVVSGEVRVDGATLGPLDVLLVDRPTTLDGAATLALVTVRTEDPA
jgi:environmental stress-induced protein Ves